VEITVTGRHVQVSDRFRQMLADKLAKVEQFAPHTQRVEVVVSHETSRSAPKGSERIEITCLAKGPVIRAEAYADDKYSALDLALEKLAERLRRAGDRRKVSRRRGGPGIDSATADLPVANMAPVTASVPAEEAPQEGDSGMADSPIQVREKAHTSVPMTLEQALYSMEMVGHDFFLFQDKDTRQPSVVYKRRGWEYGVLRLEVAEGSAVG
jgi:ribosomal subunit interface protein